MGIQRRSKIPVTLIAGFLGAGKTTLINHILSGDHGVRATVLVNDFGAIDIDARLIAGVQGDTVSLANGCACCTIRDDLAAVCPGLCHRPEPPEHLFIELSGASDPAPVLNTFLETQFARAFSFRSLLCVVDTEQLPRLEGEMARLARSQLGAADIVVLNKLDLVDTGALERVKQLVPPATPGSRIIEVTQGRVPPELIFACGHESCGPGQRLADVSHGDMRRDHVFATWSWASDRALFLPRLLTALELLPDTVYRCKGIVYIGELPQCRCTLQMVGRRYQVEESGPWGDDLPRSEIVLIGEPDGIDTARLQSEFDACIGSGDEPQSPFLRLVRRLTPELLTTRAEPTGRG